MTGTLGDMQPMAPLNPPKRLLMGSGPSNAENRVLQALAAPPLAPDHPAFEDLVAELQELTRGVFQATAARAGAVPGASRAGIEAVLASLIEPGDRVLVGVYGHFGELLCTLAARHGARVERVDAEWGSPVSTVALAAKIRSNAPKIVAIVHADTSTGILQPLAAIGEACSAVGALLAVDAVLSIGGCEVAFEAWHMDAVVGGLQKCLGGPPGLGLVACSDRALGAISSRRAPPQSAYLDLRRLLDEPRYTPMLAGACEALRLVLQEGLAARSARHRRASDQLRAGLRAMGLELFGDSEHRVPMITLVKVPDEVDELGVREQLLREHGIEIMAAFGPLRGRVWRIGAMGTNACLASVLSVLAGLEAVLVARGVGVRRGAAVDAALAAGGVDAA